MQPPRVATILCSFKQLLLLLLSTTNVNLWQKKSSKKKRTKKAPSCSNCSQVSEAAFIAAPKPQPKGCFRWLLLLILHSWLTLPYNLNFEFLCCASSEKDRCKISRLRSCRCESQPSACTCGEDVHFVGFEAARHRNHQMSSMQGISCKSELCKPVDSVLGIKSKSCPEWMWVWWELN